jgi:hypothetical protein
MLTSVRTDVRSPYGENPVTGSHFFAIFQLDYYLYFNEEVHTSNQIEQAQEKIARLITYKIHEYEHRLCSQPAANNIEQNSTVRKITRGSELLFGDMTPAQIKNQAGLKIIVERYLGTCTE